MNIEHRTSNNEIGEFMLRDRSAPPAYRLAEYLIQHSMLDVHLLICSSFKTTPYGINATRKRLQNNLALMGRGVWNGLGR